MYNHVTHFYIITESKKYHTHTRTHARTHARVIFSSSNNNVTVLFHIASLEKAIAWNDTNARQGPSHTRRQPA